MPYSTGLPARIGCAVLMLCVAAAGVWVLVDPPQSYQGLGSTLTTAWGALLAAGGVVSALAWAIRSYKLELPGMALVVGGLLIYALLSWQQTFGTSPGSGPRALLISACTIAAVIRVVDLIRTSRQARWVAEVRAA